MLKKNLVKYRLIEEHMQAVKDGRYETAQLILRLLRKREIRLGTGSDFEAEAIAESCGCRISYSRNYYSAYVRF